MLLKAESYSIPWICQPCLSNAIPFNHIVDDLDFKFAIHTFFQIDHPSLHNGSHDDLQFDIFSLNEVMSSRLDDHISDCSYYFNDTFNVKINNRS